MERGFVAREVGFTYSFDTVPVILILSLLIVRYGYDPEGSFHDLRRHDLGT